VPLANWRIQSLALTRHNKETHMADLPPYPDASEAPDLGSPTRAPRWVKVFGIIAVVLVLLFVISALAGGGHGPGRHMGGHPPASSVPGGVRQP
jgi:hypothetical protein